jgi:lipid-binding SYLF domain-containing protein
MAVLLAASAALVAPSALAQKDPAATIAASEASLSNFLRDPDMDWLQRNFGRAKAVMISPEIVKAGFIFGGSGGRCVLVVKGDKGWHGPAFYTTGTASAGFQAGVQESQIIGLLMIDSLMSSEFKLGGDASVAAGPVGTGTAATPNASIIYYSRSKGLYGGVDITGAVIKPSEDYNTAYYGKPVTPIDIIVKGAAHTKESSPLIARVTKLYGK